MKIINLGNIIVNNYIYQIDDGYAIIDTGYPDGYNRFKNKLKDNGISLSEIKYIFLTHAHDDHAGFLNDILANTNAQVILSRKAVHGLKRGQNSFEGGCPNKLAYQFCKVLAMLGKGEHIFPPIKEVFVDRLIVINDDNIIEVGNKIGGRIVNTPGHTGCSISLLHNSGVLFCGDAAMNGFPSTHKTTIHIEKLNDYFMSWRKIISLKPNLIYAGHGRPFKINQLEKNLAKVDLTDHSLKGLKSKD